MAIWGGLPFAQFAKGGPLFALMPKRLKRLTGRGDLHFITFCCYQRRPLLGTVRARNLAVQIIEEVRARYGFALVGYVIMPDHVHLLISESGSIRPAKIIQVFKQRLSRRMRGRKRTGKGQLTIPFPEADGGLRRFWQRRYLRLQRVLTGEVAGKIALHARESPRRKPRSASRRLALEQLVLLLSRRRPLED